VGYALGVDLGTTYTAAAIYRDGRTDTVTLGTRTLMIPSVVFLKEDGEFLTGEAAERRAAGDPGRFAREFKRRLGDPTPILLGGTPNSPQALMARLLASVVATVTEREGAAPDIVAVTFPANWGPFKRELLTQIVQLAGLDSARTLTLTEPEAAAISYSSTTKVQSGEVIAIFDLGGGTFDAAVLRKTDDGFEILGTPEGIEHLGGIDFDEAVFGYVLEALREPLAGLDRSDPAVLEGVARLRRDCVDAKEALSLDTEIAIPVAIGDIRTQIRLTRAEFETLIRPALTDTTAALKRALRSAQMEQADVKTVVLVGGSSRIPLISQLVRADLDLPVAVDTNPKYAVALGAALYAGTGAAAGPALGGALPPPDSGRIAPSDAPPIPTDGTSDGVRSRTPLLVAAGAGLAIVLLVVLVLVLKGGGGKSSAGTTTVGGTVATTAVATTVGTPTTSLLGVELPKAAAPVPDTVIAFTSVQGDNWDIYLINSDGSGLKRITANPARELLPVWSPDRRTIAYSREGVGSWELRAVSAEGGADLRITDRLAPDARASWSPDGTKVAFVIESAASGQTDLEMFDLTTRKETLLTSDAQVEGDPAWSPNGTSIAFWRQQQTNQDLWVVSVADAVAAAANGPSVKQLGVQLTNDPANDADPAWSPDGTRIAFASQRNPDAPQTPKDWDIYVVSAQGGTPQRLTTDPSDDQDPSWSPDGTKIAFGSKRDETSEIYVMNADGSNQTRLTNHPGFDGHAAWRSPKSP
jgi:Tol biopolymer transport system component/actin-like ATPase involved in cell morphogenesis